MTDNNTTIEEQRILADALEEISILKFIEMKNEKP